MNRKFGMLTEGQIEYAPDYLVIGDATIFNPHAEHYAAAGWLPVLSNPPPSDAPDGYHWEATGWEVADGAIRRVYAEVENPPPPPRVFVTADLVEALMAEGVWENARAWIDSKGLLDLVLATKEFDETNANFAAGRAALQEALGWTDAEVEELLAKCVKEGY